jgi:hypothetical protein
MNYKRYIADVFRLRTTRTAESVPLHRLFLILCIALSSAAATAQSEAARHLYLSAATVPTNTAGIFTYATPPANFNVLAATDEELATYGFPPRPNATTDPAHYRAWERAMQAAKHQWHGELKPLPSSRPKPSADIDGANQIGIPVATVTTPTTLNWSGVALTNKLAKWSPTASFSDIWSEISVSTAEPAFSSTCNQYHEYSWMGLDGFVPLYAIQPGNNKSALVGGLAAYSICGPSDTTYLAMFGWEPANIQAAFTIHPGDVMYAEVQSPPGGVNASYLFLEDLTTLTYNAYSVPVPYGVKFVGNSAQWIVERPCCRNSGYPYPLANTISIFFDGSTALTGNGHVFYPGSQAVSTQVITMRDDNNDQNIELINQGVGGYEGLHALLFQTTGCAYTGGCAQK